MRVHDDIGSRTATEVFIARPDHCRVVVLQHGDEFWVVDVMSMVWVPHLGANTVEIGDKRVYPTLDAAIVAASITY